MMRIPAAWMLMLMGLCTATAAYASELYTWTDKDGVTHIASSLEDVPKVYRDQVSILGSEPESGTAVDVPPQADEPAVVDAATPLDRFEVPYQAHEGSARRVILSVTFNDRVTAPMALDTGSPGMVISIDLAEQLGLFSRDSGTLLTEAAGIGGSQLAVLTIVDAVSVGNARDAFVPTTVTSGMSDAFQGLLGMDFLTNYTISIDSQREVVVFQEIPPSQDSRGGHGEAWWRKTFKEFRSARDYWKEHSRALVGRAGTTDGNLVEFQTREAERLLQRLDMYASDNAVPRHWR
jgi:hypothetical protein